MSCQKDKQSNIEKTIEKIKECASKGANIICLQELFASLYFCDVEDYENFKLAEEIPGSTTKILSDLAKELGVVIIASLFEKRMNAAKLVADYKKKNGLPVEDLEREKALLEKMLPLIENEELKSYYIGFMNNTMEISKAYQRRLLDGMKVAFSGVKGAFADIAVKRIFPYKQISSKESTSKSACTVLDVDVKLINP